MIAAVIDTNVLFKGLTTLGPEADIADAWAARQFLPCVSTALAFEYRAVLLSRLNLQRRPLVPAALQALLSRARFTPIRYSYRPSSPDPGDDHVVDCVLNANACLVTNNLKDFMQPASHLGFSLLTPADFLSTLRQEV